MNIHQSSTAWYTQPWAWFTFGIPFLTVIAGLFTIYLAVSSSDGLVTDDYYKEGVGINQDIERHQLAKHLQISAQIVILGNTITAELHSGSQVAFPSTIDLNLYHATRDQNQTLKLIQQDNSTKYSAKLPELSQGSWNIHVETEQWRLKTKLKTPFPQQFVVD